MVHCGFPAYERTHHMHCAKLRPYMRRVEEDLTKLKTHKTEAAKQLIIARSDSPPNK